MNIRRSVGLTITALLAVFLMQSRPAQANDYHIWFLSVSAECVDFNEIWNLGWGSPILGILTHYTIGYDAPEGSSVWITEDEYDANGQMTGGDGLQPYPANNGTGTVVTTGGFGSLDKFPFTFRLTAELYVDTPEGDVWYPPESGTLLDHIVATGSCTEVGPAEIAGFNSNQTNVQFFNPDDGRIHPDAAAPFSAYCTEWGLAVYGVNNSSDGYLAFSQTNEQLNADIPTENTLLAESGDIHLYRLTTGELQINAGPDIEGKEYILTWNGCPLTSSNAAIFDHITGQTIPMDTQIR